MKIIKKYKNRILYDTQTSKPVTLKEISEMIRNNIALKIQDNTSGQDITRVTILQMLLDMEKSERSMRHLIPDILIWTMSTSKQEFNKAFRDLLDGHGLNQEFGQDWARRLVRDSINKDMLPSEHEAYFVEIIASHLNELYEQLIHAVEYAIADKIDAIGRLLNDPSEQDKQ